MYEFLLKHFPKYLATILIILWYTVLGLLLYIVPSVPQAEFSYLGL